MWYEFPDSRFTVNSTIWFYRRIHNHSEDFQVSNEIITWFTSESHYHHIRSLFSMAIFMSKLHQNRGEVCQQSAPAGDQMTCRFTGKSFSRSFRASATKFAELGFTGRKWGLNLPWNGTSSRFMYVQTEYYVLYTYIHILYTYYILFIRYFKYLCGFIDGIIFVY